MTELDRELPEGYKMTELGPLPEEWEVVKLGDVGNVITGNTPSKRNKEYWENGEIDFIKPPDLQNRTITTFSEKLSDKAINKARIVKEESVLVSCIGNIGRVGFALKPVAFNQQINAIITNNKICNEFLFYVLQAQQKQIENLASFTTVPIVSKAKFVTVKIPLPPLPEQRKIAAVLSTVQEAKEKTEAVISAAKSLKKSMMSYLFTYGPVPLPDAENIPQKETEIGMIPEEWEVVRLGDVAEDRRETVDPKKKDITDVGLEHLTPGTIRLNNYGNSKEIKSSKSKFYKDDILYAKLRPYLDKGVLAEFEGICSTDIIVIQPNKRLINPQYLAYFIHISKFLDFATKSMTGVNHPRTSWSILKTFKIPLPPLPEQEKIASMLSAIDEKIEAEENKKKALEDLFNTLLHNLMTARIRVNHLALDKAELAM